MEKYVENVKKLLDAVVGDSALNAEDKREIHEFILEAVQTFPRYVCETNQHAFTIHSIMGLREASCISQEEFERQLKSVDLSRREAHNGAIDACNQLNRLCDKYGLSHICEADTEIRSEVALFTARFAAEVHGYALKHNDSAEDMLKKL